MTGDWGLGLGTEDRGLGTTEDRGLTTDDRLQ